MALTYTYKITGLKVRDEAFDSAVNPSAVVQTYWKLTGVDEQGNEGTFDGATPFTTTTMPAGSTFTPFNQLTEAQVIGWIQEVVDSNPNYKQHIDAQILKQIAEKIRPVTEPQMPWAPPTPPAPVAT
jgi:hypothetical protein